MDYVPTRKDKVLGCVALALIVLTYILEYSWR